MAAGHGHGHGHGHDKLVLPDHTQWKTEGTPLERVQKKLAARGLRDPWARNEAWRYMGGAENISFMNVLFKGFKWGFAAFVVAVGAEYFLASRMVIRSITEGSTWAYLLTSLSSVLGLVKKECLS